MTKDQALKLALKALKKCRYRSLADEIVDPAIIAINEALAQPEQKPVAWRWKERINNDFDSWVITSSEPPPYAVEKQPLYTAPPQRKPLTHPQIHELDWPDGVSFEDILLFVRAIERAHGIKEQNT